MAAILSLPQCVNKKSEPVIAYMDYIGRQASCFFLEMAAILSLPQCVNKKSEPVIAGSLSNEPLSVVETKFGMHSSFVCCFLTGSSCFSLKWRPFCLCLNVLIRNQNQSLLARYQMNPINKFQ